MSGTRDAARDHQGPRALTAYGWDDAVATPVAGGLINLTFVVERPDGERAVLQRLHPVFGPEVHVDIEAVTAHLERQGLVTPRLLRTPTGALWTELDDGVWRLMSFVPGRTLHRIDDTADAAAAAALVARFHRAVAELEHRFAFTRAGVHDTAAHLAALELAASATDRDVPRALADDILAAARDLPALPDAAPRITHGDLKISNVLFHPETRDARCLIDLDTLGEQTIAFELGDALRSWCNPSGEDVTNVRVDEHVFEAAIDGYAAGGWPIDADEAASIVPGLETVCVELAARFCADAVHDRYFGWDPGRFPDRPTHNLVRARGQLALAHSVRSARSRLEALVASR